MKIKTFIFSFLCLSFSLSFGQKKESSYTLGGLLFGDVYYVSQNHLEEASNTAGAVLRRAYLTFDANINKKWFGRARLETNQSGEFGTYDFETDAKDLFIGYNTGRHKIILGLSPTKTYDLIENIWGLRYLVRTPMDLQGVSSRDFGIAVDGAIDKKNKFSYRFMLGSGENFGNETGDGKKIMAAVCYKPANNYYIDIYADYEELPGESDRSTIQLFSGYKSDGLRWGIQYSNQFRQENPALELLSGFVVKKIYKEISAIGRIDRILEPSPNGNNISYIPFDPTTKATFFITGIEIPITNYFTVTPNVLFTTYDKIANVVTPNNDLQFRCTLFLNLE